MGLSPTIRAERTAAARAQRQPLLDLLAAHSGNHRRAAAAVGVPESTFRRRLRAAGITAEELREAHPLAERQPMRRP